MREKSDPQNSGVRSFFIITNPAQPKPCDESGSSNLRRDTPGSKNEILSDIVNRAVPFGKNRCTCLGTAPEECLRLLNKYHLLIAWMNIDTLDEKTRGVALRSTTPRVFFIHRADSSAQAKKYLRYPEQPTLNSTYDPSQ